MLKNLAILSTTNEPYIQFTEKCLTSFNKFHPEIPFYLFCVNVSDEKVNYLNSLHENIHIIRHSQDFEKQSQEAVFCSTVRFNLLSDMMNGLKKNVMWFDADIKINENIDEFFNMLLEYDFAARIKNIGSKSLDPSWQYPENVVELYSHPEGYLRSNAAMIWCRHSQKNIDIIREEIIPEVERIGRFTWMSEQNALNKALHNHIHILEDIDFLDIPKKFNGLADCQAITHVKGPKKCYFSEEELNEMESKGHASNFKM